MKALIRSSILLLGALLLALCIASCHQAEESETAAESSATTASATETDAPSNPEAPSESTVETLPEIESVTDADSQPDRPPETETVRETGTARETETEIETETETESLPETTVGTEGESDSDTETETQPETETASESDTETETISDSEPMPTPTPGSLGHVQFDRGYVEDGIVYGRLFATPASNGPTLQILRTKQDFNEFSHYSVHDFASLAQTARSDSLRAFAAAMATFDDGFFEEYALAVICPGGASGSFYYRVSTDAADGKAEITVATLTPENGIATMDIVRWAILVPLSKEVSEADITFRQATEVYKNPPPAGDVLVPEGTVIPPEIPRGPKEDNADGA